MASLNAEYSLGASAGTVVSGTLYPLAFYPSEIPGAPTPTVGYFGMSVSSTTTGCRVCTYVNGDERLCSAIAGCLTTTTSTSTGTVQQTTTGTIDPAPTVTADCAYWYVATMLGKTRISNGVTDY